MTKKIDYLDEDREIPGQKWWCVSFLSPEGLKNCKIRGLKCRGTYSTKEEADARADYLQKNEDPDFHVYVGEVGKWLPWDPDPNTVTDQVYKEEKLQEIMQKYKENLAKTKMMEQERKADLIQESVKQNQKSKRRDRLKQKVADRKKTDAPETPISNLDPSSIQNRTALADALKQQETVVNSKQELADKEHKRIEELHDTIQQTESSNKSIDDSLSKIQDLYNKLHKKKVAKAAV